MRTLLLFGVALVSLVVSIALAGMSYRRQKSLSLAASDSLRKITLFEPERYTLFPINPSPSDFQQTRAFLPSDFLSGDDPSDSSDQEEEELDQPSLGVSAQSSSIDTEFSLNDDPSFPLKSETESDTRFKESYGILLDQVPSAIQTRLSPQFSISSSRPVISSMLSDEQAWYSQNYTFSSDQWFGFPPFHSILGNPPSKRSSTLSSAATSPRTLGFPFFLSESHRNSSNEKARHASYSKFRIRFIGGSNSPFMEASNLCIDSSRRWRFFFEGGNYQFHYPSKQSSFRGEVRCRLPLDVPLRRFLQETPKRFRVDRKRTLFRVAAVRLSAHRPLRRGRESGLAEAALSSVLPGGH